MGTLSTVIFDLDGLLADTECLHSQGWRQTLADVGVPLTESEYAEHWIRSGKGIRDFVVLRGLDHDPIELRRRKAVAYASLVSDCCRAMPGAVEVLNRLKGRKRLALATSAYREDAMRVVRALQIEPFFEVIAVSEDVARVKPYPDLFLFAAEKLGVSPAHCVVLEDAEKGVRAAVAAGMKVIAVPNDHTRSNDFSMATRIVSSLYEIDEHLLDILGAPGEQRRASR